MGHGTEADTYNVLSVSPLFDGDLLAPNNTSLLVEEIEP